MEKFRLIYYESFSTYGFSFYFRGLFDLKRFEQFLIDISPLVDISYNCCRYADKNYRSRKKYSPRFLEFPGQDEFYDYLGFMNYGIEINVKHLEIFYNKFVSWSKMNNYRYYTLTNEDLYDQPKDMKEFYLSDEDEW